MLRGDLRRVGAEAARNFTAKIAAAVDTLGGRLVMVLKSIEVVERGGGSLVVVWGRVTGATSL